MREGGDESVYTSPDKTTTRLHHKATATFFKRVSDRLNDDIDALYLFGSVARDTITPDSDVDVLAVIAEDVDYATVDDQLLDIAYDIRLKFGIPVEVHSIRASEFAARKDRGDPFIRNAIDPESE